ncbi:MAG: hypothetical protein HOV70_10910 [Streptomyces sp.]|nr:hypothetical protein [Streptomyces sp.]
MDDLVQFLRDRLAEDKQSAEQAAAEYGADWRYDGDHGYVVARRESDMVATGSQDYLDPFHGDHIARHDPARVLREVEAKRRTVDLLAPIVADESYQGPDYYGGVDACEKALFLLALPYADHPDYQETWRP